MLTNHYISDINKTIINWINKKYFVAMITIKFISPENDNYNLIQFNKVIRNMNKRIYGKSFVKNDLYLNGVVSIEKNIMKAPNKFHLHLLIEKDERTIKHNIYNLLDIAIRSSKKIRDSRGEDAFYHGETRTTINKDGVAGLETNCFHIIETYNEFAASYISKKVTNLNADQIKILSNRGLSDTDLSFMKNKNIWC